MTGIDDLLVARLGGVVAELAGAGVMVAGAWALGRIAGWAGVARDDRVRAYLEAALERAVDRALGQVPAGGESAGEVVPVATAYLRETVPQALKTLSIAPDTLDRMVEARLAARAAGSKPQTPPVQP
jgi:AcrR family transcriptional regulator